MSSKILTDREVDEPIIQGAKFRYDKLDRAYIDEQARGAQQHLVENLISGFTATWFTVSEDSPTLAVGDVVCVAGSAISAYYVTLATAAALANAGRPIGVCLTAASPTTDVRVAMAGVLPASITGLVPSDSHAVRVSTVGRCETVSAFSSGDYPVGFQDNVANLTLNFGVGAAGDGGPLTGDAGGHLALTYPNPSLANGRTTKADLRALMLRSNRSEIHLAENNRAYRFSTTEGAGIADNGYDCIKPTDVLQASNGRWIGLGETEVPTIAALRTLTGGFSAKVHVRAFATDGDGGGGHFLKRAGSATDNGGTIIVPTGVTTFYYERQFSGAVDARWFGCVAYPTLAAASSGTDSYAALLAATRAVSSITNATAHRVDLPYGYVQCSNTLEISRRVYLKGHGKSNSVLVFTGLVPGVEILHSDLSSDGGDGSGSTLEDFSVWAASTAGNVDGVWINANDVSLNRVDSLYWGRWTFTIFGSVPGTQGNANDWRMTQCSSWYAGQAGSGDDCGGLYIHGNDSSAGSNTGFRALQVTGIGVREESFLGDYHEQCHVEIATGVAYKTRPGQVSRSTFVSCYAEGAEPIEIYYPNVWVGGFAGNGFAAGCTGLILPDSNGVYPFGVPNRESGNDATVFYAGDYSNAFASSSPKATWGVYATNSISGNTENYSEIWDDTNKVWRYRRHGNSSNTVREITGWGHDRHHSQLHVPNLTVGSDRVRVTSAAAMPSSGIWYKGDLVLDSTSTVLGWTCTTAGGWGTVRNNSTAYSRYDAITVSGNLWENVSDGGTTAGSPPAGLSSPGTTVVDGTVTWKYRGPTPAVFEVINAAGTAGTPGAPGKDGADATPDLQGPITIGGPTSVGFGGSRDVDLTASVTTILLNPDDEDRDVTIYNDGGAPLGASVEFVNVSGGAGFDLNLFIDGIGQIGVLKAAPSFGLAPGYCKVQFKTVGGSTFILVNPGNLEVTPP